MEGVLEEEKERFGWEEVIELSIYGKAQGEGVRKGRGDEFCGRKNRLRRWSTLWFYSGGGIWGGEKVEALSILGVVAG